MTLNRSGIRDIQRVLGISIVCILFILRGWFKTLDEPVIKGHFKRVQIDEMWTFVKHRKAGKSGFGTLMMLIRVKFWPFTSENAMIQLVRLRLKN